MVEVVPGWAQVLSMALSLIFSYHRRDLGPGRSPLQLKGAERKSRIKRWKPIGAEEGIEGLFRNGQHRPQGSLLGFFVSQKMETRHPISGDTMAAMMFS